MEGPGGTRSAMQKLRDTFRKASAGSPASLEVPKQVRSASFDEIRLKKDSDLSPTFLDVPRSQRSRSFDSAGDSEPSRWRLLRRPSRSLVQCVHCAYLEEVSHLSSGSSEDSVPQCPVAVTLSAAEEDVVTVLTLQVPDRQKQVRSVSMDSSFLSLPGEEVNTTAAPRSKSYDVLLFTDERRAIQEEVKISLGNGETRILRTTPDWSENALNGDHIWVAAGSSGDFCYMGENECLKQGQRMRCPACKISAHAGCINLLLDRMRFPCKSSFKDVGIRQYREQTVIHHHWVHRRAQKGRCHQCAKTFQTKLPFGGKEIVAISCSWCKTAYHNKESCFNLQRVGEQCHLGFHANLIVPPTWIVKLPRKGSFKSSLRRSPKKRSSTKRKSKNNDLPDKDYSKTFALKPIPSISSKPLLVFINPKSGGNQGAKLLQKFQWWLNPRQVFDLSLGGPQIGLDLFKKVPNLRILACGGDGTVGWILSILDQIGLNPSPPIAMLPLGTGNDLARSLGWGGGYTDEPISKILTTVEYGDTIQLDRWDLKVQPNIEVDPELCEEGKDCLPLNVVNNYFSLGVDAHIALEFHEAREAHPERFNSRLRNKMFYGTAGGKDLLQRKWKDLCNYVTLVCDDQDLTPKLRELKVHSVLFLNIPSYGGGTRPWGNAGTGLGPQKTDDGLIEVIGLTTYQLPFLQAGGHGTCLIQCRSAKICTSRTIPMQVDGEPCRLLPSIIELKLRNQANMVAKSKRHEFSRLLKEQTLEKLEFEIKKLLMSDYEMYHYDHEKLKELAIPLGCLCIDQDNDLESIRHRVNQLIQENTPEDSLEKPSEWCFLDSCTAERFFRIDKAQEHLHYLVDICTNELFILDQDSVECKPKHLTVPSITSEDYDDPDSILEKISEEVVIAGMTGDIAMLRSLHQQGYSLLAVDLEGRTALHHAAAQGHKECASFLMTTAASHILDITDNERGRTPLHEAAFNKQRTVCCMLVSMGSSLTKTDSQGYTAKELALEAGDPELASYLESQEHFSHLLKEDKETAV